MRSSMIARNVSLWVSVLQATSLSLSRCHSLCCHLCCPWVISFVAIPAVEFTPAEQELYMRIYNIASDKYQSYRSAGPAYVSKRLLQITAC